MAVNRILKRLILPFLGFVLAVMLAFAAGFIARPWYEGTVQPRYPILADVLDLLQQHGIQSMPAARDLEYGLIRGALQAYNDPYTSFVEPAQNELQSNDLQGKFGGIGVRLERDESGTIFLYPFPDSPALDAGALEGDVLVQVEELVVLPDTPIDEVQAALRGPVGQPVHFTVRRASEPAAIDLTARRAETALPSLTWNLAPTDPRVGMIQINIIAATTPDEVETAAADLIERGAQVFLLDLRNNGGGLLDAGVDTARLFLKDGVVISQQYRGEAVKEYRVDRPGLLSDVPLAVLVNGNTASAAEIIAGALQGQGRARLIGAPTYGKDTIQLVYNLRDGSSLHVTSARWWLPGKEAGISGQGLAPDTFIDPEAQTLDAILEAARQVFGLGQ